MQYFDCGLGATCPKLELEIWSTKVSRFDLFGRGTLARFFFLGRSEVLLSKLPANVLGPCSRRFDLRPALDTGRSLPFCSRRQLPGMPAAGRQVPGSVVRPNYAGLPGSSRSTGPSEFCCHPGLPALFEKNTARSEIGNRPADYQASALNFNHGGPFQPDGWLFPNLTAASHAE